MSWISDMKAWLARPASPEEEAASEPPRADQLTYVIRWSAKKQCFLCRVRELSEVRASGTTQAEALEAGRSEARVALDRRAVEVVEAPSPSPPPAKREQPGPAPFETRIRVKVGPPRGR